MQKWEYLVVYLHDSQVAQEGTDEDHFLDADTYTEKLNKYGAAGWELVSFQWTQNAGRAALKRPKS